MQGAWLLFGVGCEDKAEARDNPGHKRGIKRLARKDCFGNR
jgi:hypothetical protein